MRIGFDAKRALYNKSGLGNYSRNLLNALAEYYPSNDYFLYSPAIKNHIFGGAESKFVLRSPTNLFGRVFKRVWRTRGITGMSSKDNISIFHGLSSELPLSIRRSGMKSVVTVHDLIYVRFPGLYRVIDRQFYLRKTKYACEVADVVVAISEQTKTDLINFLGVSPDKIRVIYQGCNPEFSKAFSPDEKKAIRTKYGLPDKFLLYIGTIEERKNLLNLVKAISLLKEKIPLVAIGRKTSYFKKVNDFIHREELPIIFPEGVSGSELPAFYQMASCFIYPSLFEGFGIPVLEALVSGTPVITSKGACFSEAGGPGSFYIDPHNPNEIAEATARILSDSDLYNKTVKLGYKYSERFSNEKIANDYMELYRSVT